MCIKSHPYPFLCSPNYTKQRQSKKQTQRWRVVSTDIRRYFTCLGLLVQFHHFERITTFRRGDYKCSGQRSVANYRAAGKWSLTAFWYRITGSLVFNPRGNCESHLFNILVPRDSVFRSLPVVVVYVSVHFSLGPCMLLLLVGIKDFGLGTQSIWLDWPLSEVGTRLEQHICSIPHRLRIRSCLPGMETKKTHI